jgi:hypothetical protein
MTVIRPGPVPKAGEVFSNDFKVSPSVNGIESVLGVQSDVNPVRVLIKDSSHRVSGEFKARAAGDAHLDRPWRTVWLRGWKGRAGRRRLKVGSESLLELFGRYH